MVWRNTQSGTPMPTSFSKNASIGAEVKPTPSGQRFRVTGRPARWGSYAAAMLA